MIFLESIGSRASLSAGSTLKFRVNKTSKNSKCRNFSELRHFYFMSSYVFRVHKEEVYHLKNSPMVTIRLHFFSPFESCSQETVETLFRVLIYCCYSNNYVELCGRL